MAVLFWRGHRNRGNDMQALRRACEERLASLGLPEAYDMVTLCAHLNATRNRPIRLIPMPLEAAAPSGLLLAFPDADYIVHEENTSQHHQEHIVAHELAHLICGHRRAGSIETDIGALLFPDLDPSLIQDLMHRENFSDEQEQEAEIMAFLLGRALRNEESKRSKPDPDSTLGRIHGSLDWRRGGRL
ncbi:toxin [Kitasatospora sp. NPDC096140]|uniref:toxin n=1 Tax=Kitasatospora sp. NPDC096140 TaxID=3155425 RepID=UPI003331F713